MQGTRQAHYHGLTVWSMYVSQKHKSCKEKVRWPLARAIIQVTSLMQPLVPTSPMRAAAVVATTTSAEAALDATQTPRFVQVSVAFCGHSYSGCEGMGSLTSGAGGRSSVVGGWEGVSIVDGCHGGEESPSWTGEGTGGAGDDDVLGIKGSTNF